MNMSLTHVTRFHDTKTNCRGGQILKLIPPKNSKIEGKFHLFQRVYVSCPARTMNAR